MKSLVLKVAVGALMLSGVAFAQPSMGAKVGVGWSMWSGDEAKEFDGAFAWSAGGFAKFAINEQLGVQPEVLVSARNASFDMGGATGDISFLWLDIPVLVTYGVTPELTLGVGPMFSYFLSGKMEAGDFSADIESDEVATLPIALTVDVSYKIDDNLSAGLRYNLGLTTTDKTEEGDAADVKSGSILAMVGYSF